MTPLDPLTLSQELTTGIRQGAFLTVQAGGRRNVMTIGWGLVGFLWQRPVLMVPVRDSRHTFALMQEGEDFTVSIPSGNLQEALQFCGTRSGRDLDKFEACGLGTRPATATVSPLLDVPGIHLECRTRLRAPMDPALMDPALAPLYPAKDYHTLYFGEILTCLRTE